MAARMRPPDGTGAVAGVPGVQPGFPVSSRGSRCPVHGIDKAGRVDDLQPVEQRPDLFGAVVVQVGLEVVLAAQQVIAVSVGSRSSG